ncbi:tRNA pseudouridine(55) synthase TruB [SAR86 cluster bacterium]|nr:tRNA pseudouridine(55) synthase TruB [SAR86 cluster bacterium]
MTDGILLVNKSQGPSSNQTLQIVKKNLGIKKAGHFGTLDPLASGLLVIGVNKGTKLSNLFLNDNKSYEVSIKFGESTTTDDAEGEVIVTSKKKFTKSDVVNTLRSFLGAQKQVPPIYSAIKIKGTPSYKHARAGREIQLAPRSINIYEILIRDFSFPLLNLSISCSKGTYIRSLARDIGISLGSCAYLHSLKRTKQGNFKLSNAIKANNADLEKIYSIEEATNFLERCDLTLAQMSVLKNAKLCELKNSDFKDNEFVRLYSQNIFFGIGIYNENHLFKEFLV